MTIEQKQAIIQGYKEGKKVSLIAEELRISRRSVERTASDLNLKHQGQLANRIRIEAERLGLNVDSVDHGWIKTEEASLHFRNDLPQQSVDDLFGKIIERMQKHSPKYPAIKRLAIKDKHLLVVDPADVHIGKLALASETGHDYNIEIAKKRCLEGVAGLLDKAQGFPLEKIMLVVGNDILHFDTTKRTTTGGTPQDTEGQLHSIFEEGLALYVEIIEMLLPIADVDIVYNPSNHDYVSGFMLAKALESWFRTNKRVTIDTTICHRKHYTYGSNLITTSHGDGAKHNDMPSLMSTEHPDWSNKEKQFRYIYLHHLHHRKVTKWNSAHDTQGVELTILRSPSAPDAWHHRQGYSQSPMAIEGFIHHKDNGKIATLTHFFH